MHHPARLPRPRKGHRKVRTGCGVCKRRKVKCDESKPACGNCVKHDVECDFTGRPLPVASQTTLRPSLSPSPSPSRIAPLQQALASSLHQDGDDGDDGRQPLPLNSIHLELLHNYTTLTSHTLSSDPVLRNIWRINAPQVGFSYDFVMRSILALSALHMSLYSRDKRDFYLDVARKEHGAALRRIVAMLPHVTVDSCSALYISAALTFFYTWAAPRHPGEFSLVGGSGVAEWVFLLQGVRSISENWRPELTKGPFSAMFRLGHSRVGRSAAEYRASTAWLSTTEHAQLTQLRRIIATGAADSDAAAVLEMSIENLENAFCATFLGSSWGNSRESTDASHIAPDRTTAAVALTSDIYSWLYKMDDAFIEMLNQRSPLALVVFAHFCVLLKFLVSCWWMQGWPTHLLQEIWDLLEPEHRLWIRWPIEEIGWLPRT